MPEEAFKEDVPDLAGDSGGTGGGKEKSPVDKVTRIKYEKIYGIKIPVPFVNKKLHQKILNNVDLLKKFYFFHLYIFFLLCIKGHHEHHG